MEGFIGLALIVAFVIFRLFAGSLDTGRIEDYLEDRGCELVDKSWDPLGPGCFGEKDSRIYDIFYRDEHGNLHRASVKTSMLSGVYLTNDEIVEHADVPEDSEDPEDPALESVLEENEKLKARIRELEQEAQK